MLFKTSSVFLFTSLQSAKHFPFIWPFIRENRKIVAWRKVGWMGRMRDNRHVVFCQKLLHTQGRVSRGMVMVNEPITAAPHFWSLTWTPRQTSYLRNLINGPTTVSALIALRTFSIFFIISVGWMSARSWLVLTWHFTPFETAISPAHLILTYSFFLKSFLLYSNSFSSWFP